MIIFITGVALLTVIAFGVIASLESASKVRRLTPAEEAMFETGSHPLADRLMEYDSPIKDIHVTDPKRGEFKTRKYGDVTIHVHKRRRFK